MFEHLAQPIPYQTVIEQEQIRLDIKRLDLVHPQISGNKFYKLKYNLLYAKQQGFDTLLTFGGAYSNHIAASAYAAHYFGFQSIGMIRGEELAQRPLNPTLSHASQLGMQFEFMSRQDYRLKDQPSFIQALQSRYPTAYIVPEGGTNTLAIQGAQEIISHADQHNYDFLCCAVGTGGTITGIIEASQSAQTVLGFSALKGDFLTQDIAKLTLKRNWHIVDDYCFGGYAKTSAALHQFIVDFENQHHIPLEPIYTGKMMWGIFDLIQKGYFPAHSRILAIHSGGLQGKNSTLMTK